MRRLQVMLAADELAMQGRKPTVRSVRAVLRVKTVDVQLALRAYRPPDWADEPDALRRVFRAFDEAHAVLSTQRGKLILEVSSGGEPPWRLLHQHAASVRLLLESESPSVQEAAAPLARQVLAESHKWPGQPPEELTSLRAIIGHTMILDDERRDAVPLQGKVRIALDALNNAVSAAFEQQRRLYLLMPPDDPICVKGPIQGCADAPAGTVVPKKYRDPSEWEDLDAHYVDTPVWLSLADAAELAGVSHDALYQRVYRRNPEDHPFVMVRKEKGYGDRYLCEASKFVDWVETKWKGRSAPRPRRGQEHA